MGKRWDYDVPTVEFWQQCLRVLKPGGNYFAVSYGKPESRSFHLEQAFLSFDIREFVMYDEAAVTSKEKEEKTHYVYVCTKRSDADQVMTENFEKVMNELLKQE
jgi:ubiquinone/menaquinone biosynthesis C-methylase UbiE